MTDYYLDSVTGSDADNGTTRALAEATLAALLADMANGDRGFVDDGHSETPSASTTHTFGSSHASPKHLICVDFAGTADPNPPVSADLRTAAIIGTANTFSLSLVGQGVVVGVRFLPGNQGNSGSNNLNIGVADSVTSLFFQNCEFALGTSASCFVQFGNFSSVINAAYAMCLNTSVRFGATGQGLKFQSARVIWVGLTLLGTAPTTLCRASVDAPCDATFIGADLSSLGSGKNLVDVGFAVCSIFRFVNCKLGSSVSAVTGTFSGPGGVEVYLWNCDSADTIYRHEAHTYAGSAVTVTDVVRASGYNNGTAVARKVTTSANVSQYLPWIGKECMELAGWFSSTGSKTLTVYFIHGEASALTNAQIWLELAYLGTSGFPISTYASDGTADILASAASQTATTSIDWDNGATARANNTAYSVGDIRRAATPNGKLFIVTTSGTSDSSEPAGFGSSNDGDSINDGTVVWRQMWRQSMDVTVTVNEVGPVRAQVCVAVPSISVWFCPKMEGAEQQPVNWDTPLGPALSLVAAAGGGGGLKLVGAGGLVG